MHSRARRGRYIDYHIPRNAGNSLGRPPTTVRWFLSVITLSRPTREQPTHARFHVARRVNKCKCIDRLATTERRSTQRRGRRIDPAVCAYIYTCVCECVYACILSADRQLCRIYERSDPRDSRRLNHILLAEPPPKMTHCAHMYTLHDREQADPCYRRNLESREDFL